MKAQAPRPHQPAPQSRTDANRGFPYLSRVVEDNRSETTAQHAAFALIQRSARVLAQRQALDAINESPRMVAQRNAFASKFQRPAAGPSGSSVIQRYQVVYGDYAENDGGRAGASVLWIRLDGWIGGPGHNNPKSPQNLVPGWVALRQGYKFRDNEPYAMHLVNGRLGGSGTNRGNLAWGSHNFNDKHCRVWEQDRQDTAADMSYAGCLMKMMVVCMYKSGDPNDAGYYYLDALMCTHSLEDPKGKVIDKSTDVPIFDDKEYEPEDPDWTPGQSDESDDESMELDK